MPHFHAFLACENNCWQVCLTDFRIFPDTPVFLTEGDISYRFVASPSNPTALEPGEFTVVPAQYSEQSNADLLFRPLSGQNPNLDDRNYRIATENPAVLISDKLAWRGYQPVDESLRLDLFADPRLRDFVQSFRRNRASELWSLEDPGKTAIAFAISKSGANTLSDFLYNSGAGPFCYLYYNGEPTLRGLKGLAQNRERMTDPRLPALVLIHRWVDATGFLPAASCFTVLREPFRRIMSSYYFGLGRNEYATPLEDFVDHLCGYGFTDWQSSWLCNLDAPVNSIIHRPYAFHRSHIEPPPTNTRLSEAALARARTNLARHFFFVGVTELFDESVFIASLLMGSRFVGRFRWLNRSSASDGFSLSARNRRRLEALCEPERALYDEVRRRFESDFAEEIAFFRTHVGSLRLS